VAVARAPFVLTSCQSVLVASNVYKCLLTIVDLRGAAVRTAVSRERSERGQSHNLNLLAESTMLAKCAGKW
ncbi:jg24937, partial [Pararge aegeria aegeria]